MEDKLDIHFITLKPKPKESVIAFEPENKGRHQMSFDNLRETILDSIKIQLDDLEEKIFDLGEEFNEGVVILPYIKLNYTNQEKHIPNT